MEQLLLWLQHTPQLLEALCAIRRLPPATYSNEQWATLRNVFTVLRQAVAELKVVFAEHNQVDFTELSLAAVQVLKDSPERVLDIAGNIRHLLIDEFQDTSRRQHELVPALLAAWDPGEGRTVFLVGDPMQSIYMFRQAEVELFTQVREHGIGTEPGRLRCRPVQLSVNFRSHAGLTEPLNGIFDLICAEDAPPGSASVPFARATASSAVEAGANRSAHPPADHRRRRSRTHAGRDDARAARGGRGRPEHRRTASAADSTSPRHRRRISCRHPGSRAQSSCADRPPSPRAEAFRSAPSKSSTSPSARSFSTFARSRTRCCIPWIASPGSPYCAPRGADSRSRTCTSSPAPTIPPSGTTPSSNSSSFAGICSLTMAGSGSAAPTEILRRALDLRWRQSESPSFASWIERTWRTLGGPACIDAAAYENTQVFFSLLDAVAPDGLAASTASFDAEFDRLFAQPDPAVSERAGIQLMTIHKAKGLGFDVVIVPGLDRRSSGDPNPLVCSLERMNPWSAENEFLVAPIGLHGEDTEPLYKWVRKQRQIRFDEERKRLLYVACTRARRELHLLGTAVASATGVRAQSQDSLLATAWPALRATFESALRQAQPGAAPSRIIAFPSSGEVREMAAVADSPRLVLRRLPLTAESPMGAENVTVTGSISVADPDAPEFQRREGSRESRLIGSTVHTFLERLGPELERIDAAELRVRIGSLLRAAALTGDSLKHVTDTVTKMLLACAADPVCRWIVENHPEAQSEPSWTGFLAGSDPRATSLRTLRADRVFRAGPAPLDSSSADFLWVIDYKTAEAAPSALLLASERAQYAPQLLAYTRALRALHGSATKFRLGLYYTAVPALDWWDPDAA